MDESALLALGHGFGRFDAREQEPNAPVKDGMYCIKPNILLSQIAETTCCPSNAVCHVTRYRCYFFPLNRVPLAR